jgi:hypothetical protein
LRRQGSIWSLKQAWALDRPLAIRVHTFPASVTSRQKWGGVDAEKELGSGKAYDDLTAQGRVDACGLVQLATRTVGAPFVGVVAATLVIAEVLRRLNGGGGCEVVERPGRPERNRAARSFGQLR